MSRARLIAITAGWWAAHGASITFGIWIEYHQAFQVDKAQLGIIFLGLWFVCVPPRLSFDAFRRLLSAGQNVQQALREPLERPEPDPPALAVVPPRDLDPPAKP